MGELGTSKRLDFGFRLYQHEGKIAPSLQHANPPRSTSFRVFLGMVFVWLSTSGFLSSVNGQDSTAFRINTDIYDDESKPPIKTTLTLFSEGVYYDFDDTQSHWITIIDPNHGRIILLDRSRQLRTEIAMERLQASVQSARAVLTAEQEKKLLSQGEIREDEKTREWVLGNSNVEYRCVAIEPEDPKMASLYAEFADWSARLNAMYPPHSPAFLRMELNAALAQRQLIPKTIKRVVNPNGRKSALTAKIIPTWRLSSSDDTAIVRVGSYLVQFKPVTEEEFFKAEAK